MSEIKRKRWTKEEEKYLLGQVKKSPQNLQNAFRKTSIKTGRTVAAISFHFNYMRKNNPSVCFITLGETSVCINRKNVYNNVNYIPLTTNKSIFNRIKNIFRNLINKH